MPPTLHPDRLSVVLVSTRNPLNIGAAARAMSNFGFDDLRLVNPFEPSFREARSAVGAASLLAGAQLCSSVAQAVADCTLVVGTTAATGRTLQHPLRTLAEGAAAILREMKHSRVALLFGSEKRGLSNSDLDHCHFLLRIPTREQHASMNLGQAVATCLYELARNRKPQAGPGKSKTKAQPELARSIKADKAAGRQTEELTGLLLELLQTSGYFDTRTSAAGAGKVRRLVRRLGLSENDAQLLLGMLRQLNWKLGRRGR